MIKFFYVTYIFLFLECFIGHAEGQPQATNRLYRDAATEYLFQSLKAIGRSDFSLFGVPNATDISYNGGPIHAPNNTSDCKDITGSHPAFIESDFEWYLHKEHHGRWDIIAMKDAYKQGIILGYCYHLRGMKSDEFYTYKDGHKTSDSTLLRDIVANPDRKTNPSLAWYLHRLDSLVIPTFKEFGFPLIYRPFHEMTGGWFWWGTATCTAAEYIKMYRLTVDYLRNNGVRNVLYVWAPDKSTDMARYPGDDYIDVVGYDGYDVGLVDYHTTETFITNVSALSEYAFKHDKIFAITEVGTGKLLECPNFWTKNVFGSVKSNTSAKHFSWVMTWYSADWNHDKSGISYIPYKGIEEKGNGQAAVNDFINFYNDPRTIFQSDMPNLYLNSDSSAFIYPSVITMKVGESLTLIGGMKCNWHTEKSLWKIDYGEIASVDKNGLIKALKPGIAKVKVTAINGKTAITIITVLE
jgi:mannan endo-1,4-beta-mannosidase